MRDTVTEDAEYGPGQQLPRGRHGLSRETVTESQRGRIIRAMIAAVAKRGYQETRVADVVEGAGVARKTFYDYFDDKEACFLAAYDQVSGELYEVAAGAFNGSSDAQWAERIRAAVATLLDRLASRPDAPGSPSWRCSPRDRRRSFAVTQSCATSLSWLKSAAASHRSNCPG